MKEKMKVDYHVKNAGQLRCLKAICILSHHSFNKGFKEFLKQLYRMQISNTGLYLPIERFVTNLMDEVPLPDEGKILVQHEIGGETA